MYKNNKFIENCKYIISLFFGKEPVGKTPTAFFSFIYFFIFIILGSGFVFTLIFGLIYIFESLKSDYPLLIISFLILFSLFFAFFLLLVKRLLIMKNKIHSLIEEEEKVFQQEKDNSSDYKKRLESVIQDSMVDLVKANEKLQTEVEVRTAVMKELELTQYALESSLSLYKAALEAINEGVVTFDLQFKITSYNKQFVNMWELQSSYEDIDNANDLFGQLFQKVTETNMQSIFLISKEEIEAEMMDVIYLKNGKIFEISSRPQRTKDKTIGRIWNFRDVTHRTKSEEKLLLYTKDLELAKNTLEEQKQKLEDTVKELEIAKIVAEKATKARTEFLANMSHEIRTPLNAVLGFAQILTNEIQDPKHKKYIATICQSSKDLMTLMNDILDLSKIESGKLELKYISSNIRVILKEIKEMFFEKIKLKDLDFSIEIDDKIPNYLQLDEIRLRQILFNITGNAVKFTEKGQVKISVKLIKSNPAQDTVDIMLRIEDTGIGISEENQKAIFESFRQQQGDSSRKYGGTGLGLAITKRLVEMLNGEISLKSRLGVGSTFEIILPNVQVSEAFEEEMLINDFENVNIYTCPTEQFVAESISDCPLDIEKINEIKKLLSTNMKQKWEEIKNVPIIDKIIEFGSQIREMGESFGLTILEQYGYKLQTQAEEYDFDKFPKTLEAYPEIIEKISSLSDKETLN